MMLSILVVVNRWSVVGRAFREMGRTEALDSRVERSVEMTFDRVKEQRN